MSRHKLCYGMATVLGHYEYIVSLQVNRKGQLCKNVRVTPEPGEIKTLGAFLFFLKQIISGLLPPDMKQANLMFLSISHGSDCTT